ncbi:IgGFc-binding protein-like [Pseudonaja textilis]|uniref:IgGFc-binding protein-like n=1 Tax=Pseudonaja textilis TaxID=8673 RepID=UPI000EA84BE3|nr:IgGFc-binding protein-like [Pseudonaja textilis]
MALLPPISSHPDPCHEVNCGKGYVCRDVHNQAECFPEPQSCNSVQCQEGTLCAIVDGLPRCVPYPSSCHQVQCKEGTICSLTDGFPKCMPVPQSCAAVQCKEGTICAIINSWPQCISRPKSCQDMPCNPGMVCELMNGWPHCVPHTPSCRSVHCKEGTECQIVHGQPQCVPASASCSEILCERGTMCEMVAGQARCVRLPPSCLHIECKQGTMCDMVDGWPKCVPSPTCKDLNCEAGSECKMMNHLPRCLPIPRSCGQIHCRPGSICELADGQPLCVPILPSCNKIHCEEGMLCEILDGVPRCVPAITSCNNIQCPMGTICEVVNNWPTCRPRPHSCESIVCKNGTVCDIVNGWPTCIPVVPTTCASIVCREQAVCEMVNGVPTCTPIPLSCDRYKCREGTICEVVHGWPTCIPLASSCQKIECAQGSVCNIIDGWPKCVPAPPTCDQLQCKRGTICKKVNGQPACVPLPRSCEHIYCQQGTICEIMEGWPRCVPIPASCDKIHCRPGTTCKIIDHWPQCVPIPPTCDKLRCKDGSVCEIIDDWPMCMPTPASCDKIECKEGTVCEMVDDWPRCSRMLNSCEKVHCQEGTKCEIHDGLPKCISISLSCNNYHCKEGFLCQIDEGWPKCFPDRSPCEKLNCSAGMVCETLQGQPRCVPITTSCANVICKEGTICEIHHSWARCVPVSTSCVNFKCSEGTVCEIYDGRPKCLPISPSCNHFQCSSGTVCVISHGWPKCVPIALSCENFRCSEGTVCEINEGQPKCLPRSPSCQQFHCKSGTVCQINNGWPQCVPIPPSCGNASCSVGTTCQMVSGLPQCVPTSLSCDQFTCHDGSVCKMVDNWPRCLPILSSCDRSNCREGTVCEIVNGLPICAPIPPSCEKTICKEGMICQMVNGWPTCIPASSTLCASTHCHVGTVCQLVGGSPQCVPSTPSCSQFQCPAGTICDTASGWPKCVPMPTSCENAHCQSGTICQVINGWPQCVASTHSCQTIQCWEGTICRMVDGSPRCFPSVSPHVMCWASGQPHYHTFDGRSFDFQGTCTYTVAKLCSTSSNLPFFHLFTKSQRSFPFSFINQVTITIYNSNITMVKHEYGLVRINQVRSRLPVSLHNGMVSLYHRGNQLVIETQFGLKVYYDWNYYLVVKVTAAFQSQICGLCGNYNGDPNDDFATPWGSLATDAVELGKSWKVEDGDEACRHGCHDRCLRCSAELAARYNTESSCGMIVQHRSGPFHRCHSLIDPKPYLNDCVTDLCAFEGYKQILCRALKTYADTCQREGIAISAWRKHAGCPLICPDHSQHMACGTACPATCNNPDAPKKCHLPCMETCQCKPGYVLDGGKCIPKEQCGCIYHGQIYAPNEQFWGDQQCHLQCVCNPRDRKVACHRTTCREGEGCHVINGVRKCHPTVYGTCTTLGQLHYITFDGLHFDFSGTCVYRLAELCYKIANLTQFQVLVQHQGQGSESSAAGKVLEVHVYGMAILISHSRVLLNGLLINLPYNVDYNKISLYRLGWDIVIMTDFGLMVTFDMKNNIRVTVSGSYRGLTCGLCGNFNGKVEDDMMQQSGMPTTNPGELGRSWKIRDIPGCLEKEQESCVDMVHLEYMQRTSKECGLLLDAHGPFKSCHSKVPPESYFKNCVFDYCSNKGNKNIICHIISSYAAACQTLGIQISKWRSFHFCRPDCPPNSHYEVCASHCPVTCHSLFNPVLCTTNCREGCECNQGFVQSSDQCVPVSQCGCVHQGLYYKAGESYFVNGFCKERCTCHVGGIMECHRSSCGPHEECRVVEGIQKCHSHAPKKTGICHVAGDPHYITFDGATFDLQSNCTYTLARSCTRQHSLPPFSVNVQNERRSRGKISVTKVVSITAYQNTISLLREKRGIILVNGAMTYLPFRLESDSMWVFYHGDNIVLRTDFGLFVSFDQLYHLIVQVPEAYQSQMCGLCGNYNGHPLDDISLPTGQPALSVQTFSAAWKVAAPSATCTEDCASVVCGACQESRKASYIHSTQCSILQSPFGPFSACYSTINPTDFYNNCVHDLCKARGNPVILCRAVHSYVAACQAAGIQIKPWRTANFCPMKCPLNSHYELCTRACPVKCKEATGITKCPNHCAEGCQCKNGFFMAGYHCAPISQCRCFHKGMWFKPGTPTITSNCMERCTCEHQGHLTCTPFPCAAGETCALQNNKWVCVRREGHCTIAHEHIFTSFDGVSGKLPSEGSFEITALVNAKSKSWFRVVVQVKKCPQCATPSVVSVTVYFHKLIVLVNKDSSVSVNGHPVHLPAQPSKEVSITLVQDTVIVAHESGVRVLYSSGGDLTVTISATLANKVFRSCGNFNGNGADDLRLPHGKKAHTITEVLNYWIVRTGIQQGSL